MRTTSPLPLLTCPQPEFLPMTERELYQLGIDQLDIILVSGDAYVDHPSFGTALLGRTLTGAGYTVGVVAQPDISDPDAFLSLGKPRLFFSVSSGCVDTMVNHYTPNKKRRREDLYSPGGKCQRPDRAVLVYTDIIHRIAPQIPIIIGGVEASLRRFAHYDYWSDKVRQSVLSDTPATLLVFGMGERPLCEIAKKISLKKNWEDANKNATPDLAKFSLLDIPGTVVKRTIKEFKAFTKGKGDSFWQTYAPMLLPSFADVSSDKHLFMAAQNMILRHQNHFLDVCLVQEHPKTAIVQNPPAVPLSTSELDAVYELLFQRTSHPSYTEPIPALETVKDSITSHRGCYGNCSFCAIALHQGRIVQSRSPESILREVELLSKDRSFKKTIRDIGGPTANMYGSSCPRWKKEGACADKECITCSSLHLSQEKYMDLLDQAAHLPGVKHVFIGSGIRHDLLMKEPKVLKHLVNHISGQMKVAPEHISPFVLACMNKPPAAIFEAFIQEFEKVQNMFSKKRQFLLSYAMSGHPGCTIADMVGLVEFLHERAMYTEQVQDFTPTPMTVSTAMYYTGLSVNGTHVHVPTGEEKKIQRALLGWKDPKNRTLMQKGLRNIERIDLMDVLCK